MSFQTPSSDETNTYLQQLSADVFSSRLKTVAIIRKREKNKKKKKLNAADRQSLCHIYKGTACIGRLCDRNLFTKHVPESEITAWFEHVADVLQAKINDSHWIRTGTLLVYDELLFCSFCELLNQPLAAIMAFEDTKTLEIITKMMLARKGDSDKLPGPNFADAVTMLMSGLVSCGTRYFDNPWKPYKVFKKLERTGMLEQFLRSATVQSTKGQVDRWKEYVLRTMLLCTQFVGKRLQAGTPCGDTLRSIVDKSHDPQTICSYTLPFLQSCVKLSTLLQTAECQHCNKDGLWKEYKICSTCRRVHYCSKECQKADWTEHKEYCCGATCPVDNRIPRHASLANRIPRHVPISVIKRILEGIYVEIMVRLVEECDKAGGLKMKDMIIELSLCPETGGIPLLRDPPEFKIIPVARYLDGTRPREFQHACGWENEEEVKPRVECMVNSVALKLSYVTPESGLLSVISQSWVKEMFKSLQLFTNDGEPMFSQGAVDAFRIALVEDDFSLLSALFESQHLTESYAHQIRTLKSVRATTVISN